MPTAQPPLCSQVPSMLPGARLGLTALRYQLGSSGRDRARALAQEGGGVSQGLFPTLRPSGLAGREEVVGQGWT